MNAFKILEEGLQHHDHFGAVTDNAQVYVSRSGGTFYELPSTEDALTLGHLRQILAWYKEQTE